jgi:hypothetical protein
MTELNYLMYLETFYSDFSATMLSRFELKYTENPYTHLEAVQSWWAICLPDTKPADDPLNQNIDLLKL